MSSTREHNEQVIRMHDAYLTTEPDYTEGELEEDEDAIKEGEIEESDIREYSGNEGERPPTEASRGGSLKPSEEEEEKH